jgi:hypothetical protein
MGFDMTKCVWNSTIFTNATVMENDIIKCDSPPAVNWFRYNDNDVRFYFVEITIDGKIISGPKQKFIYYKEAKVTAVNPNKGPIKGGTLTRISGKGFVQEGVCNMTVRFATDQEKVIITNWTNDDIWIKTPSVAIPDDTVVEVMMNGQQTTEDIIIHNRDIENTYSYYADPLFATYKPSSGPSSGNTVIHVKGSGFRE